MGKQEQLLVIELRKAAEGGGWSILDPEIPNISNYRRVIVDATDIGELFPEEPEQAGRDAAARLKWMTRKIAEIVGGGARVAIILPRPSEGYFHYKGSGGKPDQVNLSTAVGGPLNYHPDAGLEVATRSDRVSHYFQRIRAVDGIIGSRDANLNSTRLASATFGQALALEIKVESGTYIYLPPYPGAAGEAIDIVARDLLGTPREDITWPDWIVSVPFGPVKKAAKELDEAQQELGAATQRVEQATKGFEGARAPLAVVVQDGIPLQRACEQLFRAIGLTTEPVRPDVSDEFMITGGAKPILVEVKGREGPARKGDLTQVHTDADNWEEREGKETKPLLLANTFRLLPLEQRETAKDRPFSQWIQNNAPSLGVALMTTWDLLEIYYAAASWPGVGHKLVEAVNQTDGRIDVKKVLKQAKAEGQ